MVTILIWLGSGFAFAVGIACGVWLTTARWTAAKNLNERSEALLAERNEIGKRQADSLEELAQWARENWRMS